MPVTRKVYLDYSATTPTDPRVVEVMLPYFTEIFGNSSSAHSLGRKAEAAVERARETVSRILKCDPSEIVFTSGGSESDNLAIRGAALSGRQQKTRSRVLTLPVEHNAVTKTISQLSQVMGFSNIMLPVDAQGIVDLDALRSTCDSDTVVASIMTVNNEVGSIQPLRRVSETAHAKGCLVHTDAVQAAGQISLDVQETHVDLLSLSAHKFYGPKGVGALYVRKGIDLVPNQTGGDHEDGRRAGTHSVPYIVGLAKALEIAYDEMNEYVSHYQHMRDMLIDGVLSIIPGVLLTGHPTQRLPSHASFIIDGVDSNSLIMHLDMRGVAASGGSACKTGNPEPSEVLLAMGYSREQALGSLRLTVGRQTSSDDVQYAVSVLVEVVEKLRNLGREWIL